MNEVLGNVLAIYFMGVMLSAIGAFLTFSKGESTIGARIALLSPAWPVLVIAGSAIGFRHLWKIADWKGRRK